MRWWIAASSTLPKVSRSGVSVGTVAERGGSCGGGGGGGGRQKRDHRGGDIRTNYLSRTKSLQVSRHHSYKEGPRKAWFFSLQSGHGRHTSRRRRTARIVGAPLGADLCGYRHRHREFTTLVAAAARRPSDADPYHTLV